MTDEQIAEIYALARESFAGGQKSFQIQALPFRMTPHNMARHRNSPHMAFWKMLKNGYDHFEVTHLPPKVDVCEARYVFDAQTSSEFNPTDRCPAYKIPEDIAAAVYEKHRRDELQTADLINRGIPSAPIITRGQGGMHRTFMAAIAQNGRGVMIPTATGTIPAHVNPPSEIATEATMNFETGAATQVVSAAPASMDEIRSKNEFGFGDDLQPGKIGVTYAKPDPHPAEAKGGDAVVSRPLPAMSNSQASSRPPSSTSLISGAQPTLTSGGFR
jgi:hypothetical protein